MKLYCQVCEATKNDIEFIKRKRDEPYSQKNVRCCKKCNSDRNKRRYHNNPKAKETQLSCTKKWVERNPKKMREIHKRYETKNMVKRRAKDAIKRAIKAGKINRSACEVCGTSINVHGHHDSYDIDRWLDVRWLCLNHHKEWHVILDPLKAQGEGKKVFDEVFKDFIKINSRLHVEHEKSKG